MSQSGENLAEPGSRLFFLPPLCHAKGNCPGFSVWWNMRSSAQESGSMLWRGNTSPKHLCHLQRRARHSSKVVGSAAGPSLLYAACISFGHSTPGSSTGSFEVHQLLMLPLWEMMGSKCSLRSPPPDKQGQGVGSSRRETGCTVWTFNPPQRRAEDSRSQPLVSEAVSPEDLGGPGVWAGKDGSCS